MEEVDFLGSSFAKPFYGRYLKESSGVVKKIFVDKEITSLFLDIQAFTTVAVDLKASDLVADLDKYFDLGAYNEFCVNGVKPEPGFRSEWPTDRRLAPSLEVALSIVWRCLGGPCTEA